MTHKSRVKQDLPAQEPIPMLRWVFLRDLRAITCKVDFTADKQYDVSVVPHWDVSASAIERFDSAPRALERHAQFTVSLREAGWKVIHHGLVGNAAA